MRFVYPILLVLGFISCSLAPNADHNTDAVKHSTRRADYGKYISEETFVAGSRKLFVQPGGKNCLNSSKAVEAYLGEIFPGHSQDALYMILLDKKNIVITIEELEPGRLTEPATSHSDLAQKAGELAAASVILVQILPSRSSTPYSQDRKFSQDLKVALHAVDVGLLDYVIVGRSTCFSFADNHLL